MEFKGTPEDCEKILVDVTNNTINKKETVDGPEHYNGYQVIEAIRDAGYLEGFCLGNVVKYILRAKKKNNNIEDLQKAKWYLDYFLENVDE